MKVLIIDDLFSNAFVTKQILKILRPEYYIELSNNTIKINDIFKYDILFIDNHMKGETGDNIITKLIKNKYNGLIVMISGYLLDDMSKICRNRLNGYIEKPVDIKKFIKCLNSLNLK